MAERIDIKVPDLGDFADVEVIEILAGPGDTVAAEDGLITLETDKATMDVPAPMAGTIVELTVGVGDTVSTGDTIGTMDADTPDAAAVPPQGTAATSEQGGGGGAAQAPPASPTVAAAAAPTPMTLEVPDLGDFADVEVIEIHVAAGDSVQMDQELITLETDKATMEVPSTAAGKITEVLIAVGERVSRGTPIARIDALASSTAVKQAEMPAERPAPSPPPPPSSQPPAASRPARRELPPIDEAGFSKAHASPSVRKLARELGVDLTQVKGTGPKARILHDDVKAFVKAVLSGAIAGPASPSLPQVPVVDYAKYGAVDVKPLTRIQKISGPRLQASWINLPHVTQHDLADITDLESRRQALKGAAREQGISLTPLAFIMKACVAALQEFPKVNGSLSADGASLVYKQYYHLGFAADTENGLVVPVIRDADQKDVHELAAELGSLSAAARDGKLNGEQLQGASFTISSLGGIGGTAFTPIVNAPEVAILGVSRSSVQPVWNGSEFLPRLMLPLSFSYDHRVIDGAYAVRFTTFLCQQLADVDGLLGASKSE